MTDASNFLVSPGALSAAEFSNARGRSRRGQTRRSGPGVNRDKC